MRITQEELTAILEKHKKWLRDEEGGERAVLINCDLSGSDLRGSNLYGSDLRCSNLSYSDLRCSNLRGSNLRGSDLRGSNLYGSDLYGSDLIDVKGLSVPYSCPDFGMFIGWKKASGYIVQLEIPEDAKRLSATGRKCRCDKAKVLSIQNIDGTTTDVNEVNSNYDPSFVYKVGEIVSVDDFNENRWNECSAGIHFFINRQEAVDYNN